MLKKINVKKTIEFSIISNLILFLLSFGIMIFAIIYSSKIMYLSDKTLNLLSKIENSESKFYLMLFLSSIISQIYIGIMTAFWAKENTKLKDENKGTTTKEWIYYIFVLIFSFAIFEIISLIFTPLTIIPAINIYKLVGMWKNPKLKIRSENRENNTIKKVTLRIFGKLLMYAKEIIVHLVLYIAIIRIAAFVLLFVDIRIYNYFFDNVYVIQKQGNANSALFKLLSIIIIILLEELIFRLFIYQYMLRFVVKKEKNNLMEISQDRFVEFKNNFVKLSSLIYATLKMIEIFIAIKLWQVFVQKDILTGISVLFVGFVLNYILGNILAKIYIKTNYYVVVIFRVILKITFISSLFLLIFK